MSTCRFQLTGESISSPSASATPVQHEAGAVVIFEGCVRIQNLGREVTFLEYEAMPALAEKEGLRVLQEACQRYNLLTATCTHRLGKLGLGEVAIRVEVSSPHRKEAFEGCQYIMDEVKKRVPIWKKEHYKTGDSGWIGV